MPRFEVFADVDQVVSAAGERVSIPAGHGFELPTATRVRKPTILKPTKLKPTARVPLGAGRKPWIPEESLEAVAEGEPVVAEVEPERELALEDLEPLRDQVHSTGRDLIVVVTERDG